MKICGLLPNSFVDFPGEIAAVIFTTGCNMRCWFCHNHQILDCDNVELLSEQHVLDEIIKRKSFVNSVVITGGEPTLQPDLIPFLKKLKSLGFKVKLDTNGLRPDIIKNIISQNCVDYIAMDFKAPKQKFKEVSGTDGYGLTVESANLIIKSGINHEFRTTFVPDLTAEDFKEISKTIKGAKSYYIQKFSTQNIKTSDKTREILVKEVEQALQYSQEIISSTFTRGY